MLWGLVVGGLCGAASAGVAAALAGSAALCASLVCAGGALGVIGAEGLRQRHVQVGKVFVHIFLGVAEVGGSWSYLIVIFELWEFDCKFLGHCDGYR